MKSLLTFIDCSNGLETCFQLLLNNDMNADTLLLNSCSTVCLISNGNLLHDIHTVDHWMKVRCIAGMQTTNKMGYLGLFLEAIWYDPKGIANIISLFVVQKCYQVTYKSIN
jgi:hypothetical protein